MITIRSNISANTLLHFTEKKEHLINILCNGFYPSYCIENVDFFYKEKYRGGFAPTEIAIPMVCFCDIPLSQIEIHVENYGGYALGLTKEWGIKNGINPVMYESPESNPIRKIRESLDKTFKYLFGQYIESEEGHILQALGNELLFFLFYLKPYKGKKWDQNKSEFIGEEIKFYNEREWRYIPEYNEFKEKSVKSYITKNDYLDKDSKNAYNSKLQSLFNLSFTPKDIKYIIVEKEVEVLEMVKKVEEIKQHFTADDKKLLCTKIVSLERISEDF